MCRSLSTSSLILGNLRVHIRRVHTVDSDASGHFQCEECSCSFKKVGGLSAHITRVHSQYKVSTKSYCEQKCIHNRTKSWHAQRSMYFAYFWVGDSESTLIFSGEVEILQRCQFWIFSGRTPNFVFSRKFVTFFLI